MYASTLAYIVDANVGRSSTATAMNSACRGVSAFVAAEIAIPLQVNGALSLPCPVTECIASRMRLGMVAYIPFGPA